MNPKLESIDRLLTPRQRQVCHLVCTRGIGNKAIANIMKISESTVKIHMTAILRAYCVANRAQLVLCWHQNREPGAVPA